MNIDLIFDSGCNMEREPPEADLLRPVRAHHRLDALQGDPQIDRERGC